jgi:hypothetical protein
VTATPSELATVVVDVTAPCSANETVSLHHSGVMFSETLDTSGRLEFRFPILSENVVIIARFQNGQGDVAVARVPSLADYDRVVLQWTDASDFQVHARDLDAETGAQDLVWSGSAHLEGAETDLSYGGVPTLSDDPDAPAVKQARIYTFRADDHARVVELKVTEETCGRVMSMQSIDLRSNGKLRTRDISLSMPDCSAVGDYLVLNNLVDDLMIASR